MLKKVGMVAAATTAGVIALSPLAFAGEKDYHGDKDHHSYDHGYDHSYGPDEVTNVWIEDESVQRDQINECEFDQDIESSALIGAGALVTQDQSFNCVNAGDDAELPEPEPAPLLPVVPVLPLP